MDPSQKAAFDPTQIALLQQLAQQNTHKREGSNEGSKTSDMQRSTSNGYQEPPRPSQRSPPKDVISQVAISNVDEQRQSSTAAITSFSPDESVGDLSQFNFALFDPTSPSHWIQFAQHWYNSYQVCSSSRIDLLLASSSDRCYACLSVPCSMSQPIKNACGQ